MANVEMKNVPSLTAWVLAGAAGLVAFGVARVIGALDLMPSAFIAALVLLGVGLFLTIAYGGQAVPVAGAAEPAGGAVVGPKTGPKTGQVAAPVQAAAGGDAAGAGPLRLAAPRGGVADDLKEIEGIGPALEKLVHGLGFFHFDQIAAWTEADVDWVDAHMTGFKGRIRRDKWVAQARIITSEGLEAFRLRARTNDY